MKIIKPSASILLSLYDRTLPNSTATPILLDFIFKQIEVAGRTCYKSEDKITDTSAKKFVEMLIKRGHWSVLAFGHVYLKVQSLYPQLNCAGKYQSNPYSRVNYDNNYTAYVSTNFQVLLENGWMSDLQYLCTPTGYHEPLVAVRFVCDRGVSHELVRHRKASFAQESTRYCSYAKDGRSSMTFIDQPMEWFNEDEGLKIEAFNQSVENLYSWLSEHKWKPEQARTILPNSIKTEVCVSMFLDEWMGSVQIWREKDIEIAGITLKAADLINSVSGELVDLLKPVDPESLGKGEFLVRKGFFPLRVAHSAHPQMRELVIPLYNQFKQKFYGSKQTVSH